MRIVKAFDNTTLLIIEDEDINLPLETILSYARSQGAVSCFPERGGDEIFHVERSGYGDGSIGYSNLTASELEKYIRR
ncbi:MAG: hypothetical protein ABSA74_02115 [Candidatus Staskawiczbacteria bacterium]|jgi:hypothetical protein